MIIAILTGDWIAIIGLALGLLGTIIVFSYRAGRIVEKVDGVVVDIQALNSDIIRLSDMTTGISDRVNTIWGAMFLTTRSPKYLNEYGLKILKDSGVEKTIDNHYNEIVQIVKRSSPSNAYQAEQSVISAVQSLVLDENCKNELEVGAYKTGQSIATVLYVGAIYIRDKVLKELELDVQDIDKHDPEKVSKKSKSNACLGI
jgi:hypothetical protein